jgi:hypothetical protein
LTVDEADFEQMLTTMFVTARDLLPTGGSLTIDIASSTPDRPSQSPELSVIAQGFGVEACAPSTALLAMVDRCAASLHVGGEPGRRSVLTVRFAACSR